MGNAVGKIVAIGGGALGEGETLSIDREIVGLARKRRPRALFIPTASSDDGLYWEAFQEVYGRRLGCRTGVLYLIREKPSRRQIRESIKSSDIIYVGGGNTLKMMRLWRRLGVDRLLKAVYNKGSVLCGLSAGALCWFEYGHSDSMSFYRPEGWRYIRVKGLGLIKASACPHRDGERRAKQFADMIGKRGGVGIALDDCAAIEIVDGQYRIIRSRQGAGAYKVCRSGGKVKAERIVTKREYAPLQSLLNTARGRAASR